MFDFLQRRGERLITPGRVVILLALLGAAVYFLAHH